LAHDDIFGVWRQNRLDQVPAGLWDMHVQKSV
jgi:hypothetical protein